MRQRPRRPGPAACPSVTISPRRHLVGGLVGVSRQSWLLAGHIRCRRDTPGSDWNLWLNKGEVFLTAVQPELQHEGVRTNSPSVHPG